MNPQIQLKMEWEIRCGEFVEGTMLYECSTHFSILFPFIPKLRNEPMIAQLGVVLISFSVYVVNA